jgi:integrase
MPQRHRAIFAFGMEYGLRVGEARAIQKDCIKDGVVTIKRAFSDNRLKDTKTGLDREYELTGYAKDILNSLEKHLGSFLFVRDDGNPYTNKNLNAIWKDACEKTGIKIKLQNAIRHSLGCQLVDMGVDIYHVADQLGHTDVRTTKRYAARSRETLKQTLEDRRKVVPFSGTIEAQK